VFKAIEIKIVGSEFKIFENKFWKFSSTNSKEKIKRSKDIISDEKIPVIRIKGSLEIM